MILRSLAVHLQEIRGDRLLTEAPQLDSDVFLTRNLGY
jgi:hypothetical protein